MEITSRYNLRQNIKQRRCIKRDVFSRLPDDVIICHILSRLMPREAGKCCLISRRWLSLWKQSVSCRLIFNSIFGEVYRSRVPNITKERQDFVSWINHFLDLLQHNETINEFIVRFDLESSYSCGINKWVNFAFRKGVERLELDFSPYLRRYRGRDYYTFHGIEMLSPSPGLESMNSENLRDICFKYVNVAAADIEYMLSKCHSLERLSVKRSTTLVNLNVCGESIGLKHLEILDCVNANKIKISLSRLVSFNYNGCRADLYMEYVPSLTQLWIGGDYCRDFLKKKAANLYCFSQLKQLKLDMSYKVIKKCVDYPLDFPKFQSLEQLEVKMEMYNGLYLLWPTILINAAPALRTFAIELKQHDGKLWEAFFRHMEVDAATLLVDTMIVGRTPRLTPKVKRQVNNMDALRWWKYVILLGMRVI
ncbi:hypothetical protein RND81_06G003100 [Saponaria officinalis]|uniref:F-box domain-containing protein n=1 Tax=Saponaria officinalis TaxID=3572 RepID=A0AAW1K737_SAPOF